MLRRTLAALSTVAALASSMVASADTLPERLWVPDWFGKVYSYTYAGGSGPPTFASFDLAQGCHPASLVVTHDQNYDGRVYVACNSADASQSWLMVYDKSGNLITTLQDGRFDNFMGMALDPQSSDVWVVSHDNGLVLKIDYRNGIDMDQPVITGELAQTGNGLQHPVGISLTTGGLFVNGEDYGGILLQYGGIPGTLDGEIQEQVEDCDADETPPAAQYGFCQVVSGLYNVPGGIAATSEQINANGRKTGFTYVSNTNEDAPGGTVTRVHGTSIIRLGSSGIGKPFVCPGGMFATEDFLFVVDRGYHVPNTACGTTGKTTSQGGDEGDRAGRVLVFPLTGDVKTIYPRPAAGPAGNLRASAPGFGGIFVEENAQ